MLSTELTWTDNTSFKRFVNDLPIAARCVREGKAQPEIKVEVTHFRDYEQCRPYKSSNLGAAVNNLDSPLLVSAGGNLCQVWTRMLHYHSDCDTDFRKL